jgi:RNA polymerase subunit RPABC4/transcription elongation factor Spt4
MEAKKKKSEELEAKIEELSTKLTTLTNEVAEKSFKKEEAAKAEGGHIHQTTSEPLSQGSPSLPKQKQESGLEHYRNCPTCHKEINEEAAKELTPEFVKKFNLEAREKHKSMKKPVICEGCGEIVDKSDRECPSCHGTRAKQFSY